MIEIKRILFPTDFSSCADQVLDQSMYLAAKHGATLHMLHAIVLHEDDVHHPAAHFGDIDEIQQRLRDLARIEMKAAISERTESGVEVVMRQQRGFSAADVALQYAEREEIDLIVMGTHGRRGLGRLFLGSVAEEVVRHAPCPVLTIRERGVPRSVGTMSRILVPVDYSSHASSAIRHAKEIAATCGARIDLLHVIDDVPRPAFYDAVGFSADVVAPDIEERARLEMRLLYESTSGPDVDARFHAIGGSASEEIVGFAQVTDADLIVIATHGLSGIRHILMGSVAEKVVRTAPCPVFTVKSFGKSLVGEPSAIQASAAGL